MALRPPGLSIVGYSDKISVAPGDSIEFKVDTDATNINFAIRRCIQLDDNKWDSQTTDFTRYPGPRDTSDSATPGLKLDIPVVYGPNQVPITGGQPAIPFGSCAILRDNPNDLFPNTFSVIAWILPTKSLFPSGNYNRSLFSKGTIGSSPHFAVYLTPDWKLTASLSDGDGNSVQIGLDEPLSFCDLAQIYTGTDPHGQIPYDVNQFGSWYTKTTAPWTLIAFSVTLDPATNQSVIRLYQRRVGQDGPSSPSQVVRQAHLASCISTRPFFLGACDTDSGLSNHYNGKISSPNILSNEVTDADLNEFAIQGAVTRGDVWVKWNLLKDLAGEWITDTNTAADISGNGRHAAVVNSPARAVTGHTFAAPPDEKDADPKRVDYHARPDDYNAIHLHDDDLSDACWSTTPGCLWRVPDDAASGIYLAHLSIPTPLDRAGDKVFANNYYIPFIVRSANEAPRAGRVAFLAPTLTWQVCPSR